MSGAPRDPNLHLQCPLCRGALTVDRETGVVIDATAPAGARKDFEDVIGEVFGFTSASRPLVLDLTAWNSDPWDLAGLTAFSGSLNNTFMTINNSIEAARK